MKYEDEINDILNEQSTLEELKERLVKTRELLAMANQCDRGKVLKKHLEMCIPLLKFIKCHDCRIEFAESINKLNELYEHDSEGYV